MYIHALPHSGRSQLGIIGPLVLLMASLRITASFGKDCEAASIKIPTRKVIGWPENVNNILMDSTRFWPG